MIFRLEYDAGHGQVFISFTPSNIVDRPQSEYAVGLRNPIYVPFLYSVYTGYEAPM